MARLANQEEPPESDAQWKEWQAARQAVDKNTAATNDDVARDEFLKFQNMIAGGYTQNKLAAEYMQACEHLGLNPDDPSWMIDQGANEAKKATLHPWQVIGADWLRRSKRESDINPLLADDCGLGKTIQTLAAIYADYLDAKAGRLQGPFKPTLIVAPRILSTNWIDDNKDLLHGALEMYLWQGRAVDMGTALVEKKSILDLKDTEMANWTDSLDENDPETLRKVIVSSYGTGNVRSLYLNGEKAQLQSQRAAAAKRELLARLAKGEAAAASPADETLDADQLEDLADEDDEDVEDKAGDVWSSTLKGELELLAGRMGLDLFWMIIQMQKVLGTNADLREILSSLLRRSSQGQIHADQDLSMDQQSRAHPRIFLSDRHPHAQHHRGLDLLPQAQLEGGVGRYRCGGSELSHDCDWPHQQRPAIYQRGSAEGGCCVP
jgi:hypothetical protein